MVYQGRWLENCRVIKKYLWATILSWFAFSRLHKLRGFASSLTTTNSSIFWLYLRFREIERSNLDRHSYEIQIKELTQRIEDEEATKTENGKLVEFIKKQQVPVFLSRLKLNICRVSAVIPLFLPMDSSKVTRGVWNSQISWQTRICNSKDMWRN